MKALVTGGSGFIGRHLARKLIDRGIETTVLSRRPEAARAVLPGACIVRKADLSEASSLAGLPRDFNYVFHLAAVRDSAGAGRCMAINRGGTRNLLDFIKTNNIKLDKFVYVSTLGAAGLDNSGTPKKESDPMQPQTAYGISKMLAEKEVIGSGASVPYVIIRPSKIYGPGDEKVLFHFKLVRRGVFLRVGKQERFMSLAYIGDFVDALICAAENPNRAKIYFFSDGLIYSWNDFYRCIASVLHKKARAVYIPEQAIAFLLGVARTTSALNLFRNHLEPATFLELRSRHWTCDPQLFFKDFSFKPQTSLACGMKSTAAWFYQQGYL